MARLLALALAGSATATSDQHNFTVRLGAVTHEVTTRHMGCHLDSGFGQELLGLHSNIVFSPSFEYGDPTEEPDPEKNPEGLGWVPSFGSKAQGALEMTADALHGKSALAVKYYGGSGPLGVGNRGIGNEGLYLSGSKPYEGYLFAAADVNSGSGAGGGVLHVELQNYETGAVLASQQLTVPAGSNWTRYNLSLTPTAGTECVGIPPGSDPQITCDWKPGSDQDAAAHVCIKCAGQLFIGLAQPGAVAVDFVYLEPGEWGRFKGLPVLKPMADALQTMGVKLFRAGGTVADSMFWKDWRGPMWKRKPLVWRNNEVSGFGPFETIDLCAAAGILPVMTTAAADQTAEDMGDLIEQLLRTNGCFVIHVPQFIPDSGSIDDICMPGVGTRLAIKQPSGGSCGTRTNIRSRTTSPGSSWGTSSRIHSSRSR